MIPDAQLGIAVLTNQESGAASTSPSSITSSISISARRPCDWIAAFQAIEKRSAEGLPAPSERRRPQQRDTQSKPSLADPGLRRPYRDQWYGDIIVIAANGGLDDQFDKTPALSGTLEHWQHDTFVANGPIASCGPTPS